jgi:N-acetylglucosamine kinase-like BadF-type ATPase
VGAVSRLVVGVDGGGSTTVAAVADDRGRILGRAVEAGSPHTRLGFDGAAGVVDRAVVAALRLAGVDPGAVAHAACLLSGLDLPAEAQSLRERLGTLAWAQGGLTLDNDVLAVLRAGTTAPDAAAVVCGTGMNAVAVRGDGRRAQLLAVGRPSGDWGGGLGLADAVLWHAARAEDGRGPASALHDALLDWTGAASIRALAADVASDRRDTAEWVHRVPDLLELAATDAVAARLVRRQGEEIGHCAAAVLAQVGLVGAAVPVVLGGGIGASGDPRLEAAARRTLAQRAPGARMHVLAEPPVVGAVREAVRALRG